MLRIVESLGDERAKPQGVAVFKAWVTTLGGRRFLVMEPKAVPSSKRGFRPEEWWVFRVDLQGGRLLLSVLDADTEKLDRARPAERHRSQRQVPETWRSLSQVPEIRINSR